MRVIAYLAVGLLYSGQDAYSQEKPAKVLFIGADNRSGNAHVWLHTCEVRAKAVRCTPGDETVVSNGWPKDPIIAEGDNTLAPTHQPLARHRDDFHRPHKSSASRGAIADTCIPTLQRKIREFNLPF